MNKTLCDLDFLVSHISAMTVTAWRKAYLKFKNKCEGRREDELLQGNGGGEAFTVRAPSTWRNQISTNQTNLRNSNSNETATAAIGKRTD